MVTETPSVQRLRAAYRKAEGDLLREIAQQRSAQRRKQMARWSKHLKAKAQEEQRETAAWAMHCLIDAYEDMRGHPNLHRPVPEEMPREAWPKGFTVEVVRR